MMAMKSEMMLHVIADPGNIIRSMADAATSQSENDGHIGGEGISDGPTIGGWSGDCRPLILRVFVIPEWSEKSFLYMVLSQFLSRWSKRFFVQVLSLTSQHSGKTNRIQFQCVVLAMGSVVIG